MNSVLIGVPCERAQRFGVGWESGPLILLAGEADITTAAELNELVTGELIERTLHLTIDVSGLDFADTSAIRMFVLAAKTLRQRGGDLVLLRPQRALARVLEILGADEVITIRTGTDTAP